MRSNKKVIIVDAEVYKHQLLDLQYLLESEWGAFDLFKGATKEMHVPFPLLAVDDGTVIGGLAFARFKSPIGNQAGIWINGLIVKPDYRLHGIGSRLIQAAETTLKMQGFNSLFVLTDIPSLYEKLGWKIVSISERGGILV